MQNRIFSVDNPKAIKAIGFGFLNAIHYMAPHSLAGVGNLCGNDTAPCRALCLGRHAGLAAFTPSVMKSRIAKARRFMRDRKNYMRDVARSIELAKRKADRLGLKLAVRLNGSTDLPWEGLKDDTGATLVSRFSDVQFTDYTKSAKRALAHAAGKFPANYALCFSRSESNESDCLKVLKAGGTVAAVFAGAKPQIYLGFPVVDGDLHDLRFLDPRGHVVALSPKGRRAKRDRSGFVIR